MKKLLFAILAIFIAVGVNAQKKMYGNYDFRGNVNIQNSLTTPNLSTATSLNNVIVFENDSIKKASVLDFETIGVKILSLPTTTSTVGKITWNSSDALHTFGTNNHFWGGGNTTLTTAANNTCIGSGTGNALTSGDNNLFIGLDAGKVVTSGNANIAIGYKTLMLNTSQSNNIAIGTESLTDVTGGSNLGIGNYSGWYQTSSFRNTFIGVNSGSGNTGAGVSGCFDNVFVGYSAGRKVPSNTDRCIALGPNAGTNFTDDDQLAIGNTETLDWTEEFIAGDMAADTLKINGSLRVTGGMSNGITIINSSTHNLATDDYMLHCNYTSTDSVVVTIPTAQAVSGRNIVIKDAGGNAATKGIRINASARTIDGSVNYILNSDYDAINLYSDGTNWFVY